MSQARERLKSVIGKAMRRTMGRKSLIRFGRIISDIGLDLPPNDMRFNGEREVQRFYVSNATELGTIVLDVGARFGSWAEQLIAIADQQGINMEMILFEADPLTYDQLIKRLADTHAAHEIRTMPIALSSFDGVATFTRYQALSGTNSLVDDRSAPGERFEVPVRTIDAVCAEASIDRLGFVKIDTEGNDFEVLLGASGLLSGGRIGLVQFEYNHRWIGARRVLKDVFDKLADWPYRLGRITPDGVEYYRAWVPTLESYRESNYLLARNDIANALRTLRSWLD